MTLPLDNGPVVLPFPEVRGSIWTICAPFRCANGAYGAGCTRFRRTKAESRTSETPLAQNRERLFSSRPLGQIVSQITRLSPPRVLSCTSLIHTSHHSFFSDEDLS